jgi:enterochelin esterase-like enzyme
LTPVTSLPTGARKRGRRRAFVGIALVIGAGLFGIGAGGLSRYVDTFWLYRGFAAPARPTYITVGSGVARHKIAVYAGSVQSIEVRSSALGEREIHVVVFLPPGYQRDVGSRFPVLYLLHGSPGTPVQFVDIGDLAVTADVLLAEHRIRPMIVVMPSGSTSFFVDNEWANSIRPDNGWETFVARDLVDAVDRRYRILDYGRERGIGGLSEGGYGALNIAFHHVGEFDLIEGWSAYYVADRTPTLFGDDRSLLSYNSPALELARVAPRLRANHTAIWLYSGRHDNTSRTSKKFSAALGRLAVEHSFSIQPGRHNWRLWRSMMANSLEVASRYFGDGSI